MEKYKFIVKIGQIKDLIAKGQDEKAIELAETVDFKKVKNIEDLGGIASLFLRNGMLLKARECFLELHDRVANRNIVMQLINLALRLKRPTEAEKYLREYLKIDKNDFYGLIFRYNIDKLEGKPYKELIPTLEKLKKKEYIEAWAFELAKLYHKSGDVEKCITECEDLIVFFGEGEYVNQAKKLKEYYEKEGTREAIEKEKAAKEAAERARKEKMAEKNARAVEAAFAKHDAADPDITEFTADQSEESSFAGEDETEEKELSARTQASAEEHAAAGMDEQKEVHPKYDKDDLLLMQLLREEGIEQPEGPIIEEEMELEEEFDEKPTETETYSQTREELAEAEEAAVEEATEEGTVLSEPTEEEATEEGTAEAEYTEEGQDEEKITANDSFAEEIVSVEVSEKKQDEIPLNSRLSRFLRENESELRDYFGNKEIKNDIRDQLVKAFEILLNPQVIVSGIAITGDDRNEVLEMIKGIAKIENMKGLILKSSCNLSSAEKINKMDLESKVPMLLGRHLVIEGAGSLNGNAVESILRISEKYGRKLGIILTDSKSSINALLRDYRELNSVLPVRIHIRG
ncbi:MAG: hypothetical protein K5655_00320 [Lachnospiraceae bacterium]|nr:hypothetical protein [Lachnospiraceae bacterium]